VNLDYVLGGIIHMCVLEARALTKVFDGAGPSVRALSEVSLQVNVGEFVAIVGPSGSGKSTLLNLLACLDNPSSGQVFVERTDVASLDDDQKTLLRRRRIGFIFQAFNLLPHLTAEENVAMPLLLDGVSRTAARARAADALQSVDVFHRRDQVPSKMSGGEQQRVAIARAMVLRPAIILADEPTGNLDSVTGASVIRLLQRLNREDRSTIVIVTHNPVVQEVAGRVIRLRDGRIEADTAAVMTGA
jgi:putative ABC transport system ATP-binding protein